MYIYLVHVELRNTNSTYEDKVKERQRSDKPMFALAWDLEELKKTHDDCRKLISELSNLSLSLLKTRV